MASRKIEDLDPLLAYAYGKSEAEWNLTHSSGPQVLLTCTYRPNAEQTATFNQPFDKKDNDGDGKIDEADEKVTNAKAGQSPHNYQPSMALDVVFRFGNGPLLWNDVSYFEQFAKLMKKNAGITWGGDFKSILDRPHFERTGWEKLVKKG